jgi:hypothetical protein
MDSLPIVDQDQVRGIEAVVAEIRLGSENSLPEGFEGLAILGLELTGQRVILDQVPLRSLEQQLSILHRSSERGHDLPLDEDALNLVQADRIAGAVTQLGHARRLRAAICSSWRGSIKYR